MTDVLVYTAQRWRVSTWRMFRLAQKMFHDMNVEVLTCPKLTHETFPYERLAQADIVYFRLHGLDGQPFLYGEGFVRGTHVAFSNAIFDASHVWMKPNSKVFLEGCFNALTGAPEVFLQAGADEVIAASSKTWNGKFKPGPAAKLGLEALQAWIGSGENAIKRVRSSNIKDIPRKYRMKFARYGR